MTDFDDRDLERTERELGAMARDITDQDRDLTEPPVGLLDAIRADTEADVPTDDPSPTAVGRSNRAGITDEPADLAEHRSRRVVGTGWKVAIAAAAAIVVVGLTAVLASRGGDAPTVYASTAVTNDGLEVPFDADGTADIVGDGDDLVLELDLPDLPDTDGFYEVWLIDTDVVGMISLGPAPADGRIVLPASVDPEAFPVVDVSVEPVDGVPTHSGQSILRGVLERA